MVKFILALVLGLTVLPAITLASLSEGDRQQGAFVNELKNGGFENGKSGWTASAGTFTTSSSSPIRGAISGTWDSSASGQTLTSEAVTMVGGLAGNNIMASCKISVASGSATHTIGLWDGSTLSQSQSISSSATAQNNVINFVGPSSGTVAIRISSVNANEPSIKIDECYVGMATNIGNISQYGEWTDYGSVSSLTGFGTPTVSKLQYRTAPQGVEIQAKFTSGTSTATEARLALPSVCTSASSYQTLEGAGYFITDTDPNSYVSLVEPSVSYITFGLQSSSFNGLVKRNGNSIASVGAAISINASVRCQGFRASQIFNSSTAAASWSGYQTVASGWTQTSATFAAPAAGTTIVTTVLDERNITCASDGTNAGIECNLPRAGKYRVCPSVNYSPSVNSQDGWRLVDGSANILFQGANIHSNSAHKNVRYCGVYNAASSGLAQFRIHNSTNGGTLTIQNGSATGNPAMNWIVEQSDVAVPAPVLIGSVTSNSTGAERVERASFSNSGSCANTSQSGSWVTGVTDPGPGQCGINISGFSSAPLCVCSSSDPGYICNVTSSSTSTVQTDIYVHSGAASDQAFNIICMGPR